jgi:hypothetical protein
VGLSNLTKGTHNTVIFDKSWRLARKLLSLDRKTLREVNTMRKVGLPEEEIARSIVHVHLKRLTLEEELMFERGRNLMWDAERWGLPIPSHSDEGSWTGGIVHRQMKFLSLEAQATLRKEIRLEKKEYRETWTALIKDVLVPIGGIVISVLSLMIAYAALKLRH